MNTGDLMLERTLRTPWTISRCFVLTVKILWRRKPTVGIGKRINDSSVFVV